MKVKFHCIFLNLLTLVTEGYFIKIYQSSWSYLEIIHQEIYFGNLMNINFVL
jgi:hypothetical protein